MKEKFAEYYSLESKKKQDLWNTAIFVFDACILLNLYRYSEASRKDFLSTLEKISDRIWIPHQFALEYQRNRLKVINDQAKGYEDVIKKLSEGYQQIDNSLKNYDHRHPFIKIKKILSKVKKSIDDGIKETKTKKAKHPDWFKKDPIRDEIDKLFKGKVGEPCDNLDEIEREGATRYAKNVPPGYEDIKKDKKDNSKTKKYGDWIGWYQIMQKVEKDKIPIILITGERKEDWWQEIGGKISGPRPELIKEIIQKGVMFHMYTMETFLQYAKPIYKVKPATIREVEEVNQKINEDLKLDERDIQVPNTEQSYNLDIGSTNTIEEK